MTFMNALRLYGRNARGIFFGGFVTNSNDSSGDFSVGFIWIGHIVLLPLSITLGAFAKTLFDIFTRKEIPTEQIVELKNKINLLNEDKINRLASRVCALKDVVQSKSSHELCEQLIELSFLEHKAIDEGYNKKRLELILDQLTTKDTPNPLHKYNAKFIQNTLLDITHREKFDAYNQENKAECRKQKASIQYQLINNYLNDEKNAGKYLQHAIRNTVFGGDKPKPEEPAVNAAPLLQIKAI